MDFGAAGGVETAMKHPSVICLYVLTAFALVCGHRAQAQQSGSSAGDSLGRSPAWCNPRLAGTLSVFMPGAGQMYAGETVKGAVLTSMFVGGVVAVATANIGLTHDSIRPGGWAAVIVVASSYLYALIDAPFAAARWNEANHCEEPRVTALPGHASLVTISFTL
jgi:hypothetical protein